MLLLFKGPHRFAAQIVIGIALVAIGVVAHARFGLILGGVLLAWGLFTAIGGRRSRRRA
ncbi:MAG TPA: hypothetical protein VMF07_19745 [Solirubrobacteraceae bacterium]|nr:hypothetical protein [Solirubrobacteraceae bacterium]